MTQPAAVGFNSDVPDLVITANFISLGGEPGIGGDA